MKSNLLIKLDQRSCGLIWLTDNDINPHETHFQEINYLLDGLISRELIANKDIDKTNSLFLAQNFSDIFFVIHHKYSSKSNLKTIKKNLETCPKSEKKKLLLINDSSLETEVIIKELNKTDFQIQVIEKE